MPRSWKSASVLRSNVMYTVHPKYLCSTDIQNIKNLMPPQIFGYANKCAVHPKDVCFATRIGYLWTHLKIFMHSAQYIYEAPHMFMYTDKSGLHVKHPRYLCLQIQDISL